MPAKLTITSIQTYSNAKPAKQGLILPKVRMRPTVHPANLNVKVVTAVPRVLHVRMGRTLTKAVAPHVQGTVRNAIPRTV
jgi:hypothetical protein